MCIASDMANLNYCHKSLMNIILICEKTWSTDQSPTQIEHTLKSLYAIHGTYYFVR